MEITKRELIVSSFSKKNFGIKSKEDVWYNLNEGVSNEFKKDVESVFSKLSNGDTIELTADFQLRKYNVIVIKKKAEKTGWTDDMVSFETLLTEAHKKGLMEISTEMLKINVGKKRALFKATVIGYIDKTKKTMGEFQAHGDTTEINIDSDFVKPHFIRMAETRAICRALRWYTNAGCAEEEKK